VINIYIYILWTSTTSLNFGNDLDLDPDQGIFLNEIRGNSTEFCWQLQKLSMNITKSYGGVGCLTSNKPFDFDADLDHDSNPWIFNGIYTTPGCGLFYEFHRISTIGRDLCSLTGLTNIISPCITAFPLTKTWNESAHVLIRTSLGSPRSQSRKEMWLTGEKYDWLAIWSRLETAKWLTATCREYDWRRRLCISFVLCYA